MMKISNLQKSAPTLFFKGFRVYILIIFLILLFIFFMSIALSPTGRMREIKTETEKDSVYMQNYEPILNSPGLKTQGREKTYMQALLSLSGKDSIQLAISLPDSTVSLYIRGVEIHRARISGFKTDRLVKNMEEIYYCGIFSHPLEVISRHATIVREPVVIRQAPKDTVEAGMNAWQPDTLIQNPAYVQLETEHGITLVLEQDKTHTLREWMVRTGFRTHMHIRKCGCLLARCITLHRPCYDPVIRIRLSQEDLRTVYRALPRNAFVVLNCP